MKARLHRRKRNLQNRGRFFAAETFEVAQDENLSIGIAKPRHGALEDLTLLMFHRLPLRIVVAPPTRLFSEHGERLRGGGLVDPAPMLAHHGVARNGEKPSAHAAFTTKCGRTSPRCEKRLLQGVLRCRTIGGDAPDEPEDRRLMLFYEVVEIEHVLMPKIE